MISINKSKLKYILGIVLFSLIMVVLTIKFGPDITNLIKNPKGFQEFIDSYGSLSTLVFIAFQILQVVIAAIPGEFIQIAGGYIFGSLLGTLYSVLGILTGAAIAFFAARLLGHKVIYKLLSEKSLEKFTFLMSSHKLEIIIFLLFLIPGLPKDILVYAAGLSPIRPLRFFSIYIVARMPGLLGSSLIGANIQSQNYVFAISLFVLSCLLFLVGMLGRDFIMKKLKDHHAHQKQSETSANTTLDSYSSIDP